MRESMDFDEMDEEEARAQLPVSSRPKGRYSLSDFIIHRTLGTGSFGRVHLGTSKQVLFATVDRHSDIDVTFQFGVNTIFAFTP